MYYFSSISNELKNHIDIFQVFIFLTVISVLWIAENMLPLTIRSIKAKHAIPNLLFILTGLPVQLSISIIVIIVSHWAGQHHWGLLFHLPFHVNSWMKYFIGFLMLDLLDYIYHVMMHQSKLLWKFHQVHHSDTILDVSTTLREHPVETLIRVSFLALWVFITGASFGLLIIRQTIQTISNIMAHTQMRLPIKLNKFLTILFVTPTTHAVHHHYKLPYTDSNYGDVLCIWDRIFCTYKKLDQDCIKYGLDIYEKQNTGSFQRLLLIPFEQKKKIQG